MPTWVKMKVYNIHPRAKTKEIGIKDKNTIMGVGMDVHKDTRSDFSLPYQMDKQLFFALFDMAL